MKKNKKLGLLYLIEAMHPGGAERQVCELINGLNRSKFDVYLITWVVKTNVFNLNEVKWYSFNRTNKLDLSPVIKATALLKCGKVDIVHGFLDTGNLYAAISKLMAGKGIMVASERSSHRKLTSLQRFHKPWAHKRAQLTISNSYKGKLFLNELGIPNQKILVIRNGVNTERFSPFNRIDKRDIQLKFGLSKYRKLLACIGRITPVKNQLDIVEAFYLSKINKSYDLVLVGSEDHRYVTDLRRSIEQYQLQSKVHFLPPIAEVAQFYRIVDVLVLYSTREGTPNVLFEAMSSGLPTVTADVGDCGNYIDHDSTGWIVPPQDFKKLASTFDHISKLPSQYLHSMGVKAREKLLKLDLHHESMVRKFEETYQKLAKELP